MYDQSPYNNGRAVPRVATRTADVRILENEPPFFLNEVLQVVWKRLWVVILMVPICVGVAVGISLAQTPVYEASVKILVGQEAKEGQQDSLSSSVEGLQQLTQTMVVAINSRPVAEDVIQRLELQMTPEDLLDNLTIEQIGTTQFIQLYYRDSDPEKAQSVANTLADVSSERIARTSASANDITATVWEDATVPASPISPDPVRNSLMALGLGLMLGIGLTFLLEYLDDSWRSPEEVEQVSGIPTFGVIPTRMTRSQETYSESSQADSSRKDLHGELVTIQDPLGAASEAYRMLRTNLFYALVDAPPKVIVLTSAGHREGKSTTTANLGVTLAQAGKNTLLLDCDLRKPALHNLFRTRNLEGLVNILIGEREPQEVWQKPIPSLKLVSSGPPPANSAELLSSRRLAEFLERMRQQFDYVLVDTPPVGRVSDSAVLAANADGVLLVLDPQHTRKRSLRQALHLLEGVGASILGTVMNNYGTTMEQL